MAGDDSEPVSGGDGAAEHKRRQRMRSIAIALTLGALVVLFYVLTLVKLGPRVFDRAI